MKARRVSKGIQVGDVKIGGGAPVTVQSMTKTDTRDVAATVSQIKGLEEVGCEIIRCAVPDMDAARALAEIKAQIGIPLVADIHFHHQLALEALRSGVDCLRLNPGNIRDRSKVETVVREAKARQVPIRIGVNFGSLPPVGQIGMTRGLSRHADGVNRLPKLGEAPTNSLPRKDPNRGESGYSVVDHMVETGLWEIGILQDLGFDLIKISLKAFDIDTTVESYRRMAELVPYPLHLGITEAGAAKSGSVRSAIGLGVLLYEGIGDTIRVSLSDDPREEVYIGFEILKSLGLRKEGAVLVACPGCGRANVDVRKLANAVDDMLREVRTPIRVAVMGCEVNGPGEAKDADVGIAGGAGRAVIFRKGRKVRIVEEADMLAAFMEEVRKAEAEIRASAS